MATDVGLGLELHALGSAGPRRLPTPPGLRDLHQVDLPAGIYEGMRSFDGNRFLYLERHLDRARRSMTSLGWERRLDEDVLRRGLHEAVSAFPGDARVRLDLFREPQEVLGSRTEQLLILAPFHPVPAQLLAGGVAVGLAEGMERRTPHIKRNEWIARRRGHGPGDRGYYEHLLLDAEGCILEGTSCNVFAVRDGQLWTAPAGVLGGIQRGVFLELAEEAGIGIRLEAPALAELDRLDELFLTSSTRAAVPITRVEDRPVGPGVPGPVWRRLLDRYGELEARTRPAR